MARLLRRLHLLLRLGGRIRIRVDRRRRQYRQQRLRHARQQRQVLTLTGDLVLVFANVVVLRVRLDRSLRVGAQDLRADEDHEIGAVRASRARLEGLADELSRSIFSRTASPSLICGVSLMIVPTSSRWIVWKGVTELFAEPVLVNWPVRNGTSLATFSVASWLSMVTADGVATMLELVSLLIALSIAAKLTPEDATRPTPKIAPVGIVAPPANAVVGFATRVARSTIDVPLMGEMNPPAGTAVLPWPKNAQLTPSDADLLRSTSTMMASTSTCARRMSSLSTTDMRLRMIFGVAVITSAFVCGSAQMTVPFSSFAACPCAAAAPPVELAA